MNEMTPLFDDSPTRNTTLESKAAADPTGHKIESLVGSDHPADDAMLTALAAATAPGAAWIAAHPEDGRTACPPPSASSPSEASRRGVAGARAALVGWQAGRGRR